MSERITHSDLVTAAARWLKTNCRCPIVMTELVTYASETPDAIGFYAGVSFMVECKTTRSDFLRDKNKAHRKFGSMGNHRYFLCPRGVIVPEDLPEGWGLLYFDGSQIIDVTPRPEPGKPLISLNPNVNYRAERVLLLSVIRRMRSVKVTADQSQEAEHA